MTPGDAAIVAPILAEILRPANAPRERLIGFRTVCCQTMRSGTDGVRRQCVLAKDHEGACKFAQ